MDGSLEECIPIGTTMDGSLGECVPIGTAMDGSLGECVPESTTANEGWYVQNSIFFLTPTLKWF